ncbi:uncharacterized protein LOC134189613 [Corticium candelabrum]|uniref:uncharacterized protein LOC134189613 n=1 Tax=Corticium candelabrum TaxID=121492 RepID=UPI002E2760C2|nr:uncharacterized protein LOC134189613 [Corticium candelabrum]
MPPITMTPTRPRCGSQTCLPHQTCETFMSEKYCADTCNANGPCKQKQICQLKTVQCVRAPCPPLAECLGESCKVSKIQRLEQPNNCTRARTLKLKTCSGLCRSGHSCKPKSHRERLYNFRNTCTGKKEKLPVILHKKCSCQEDTVDSQKPMNGMMDMMG